MSKYNYIDPSLIQGTIPLKDDIFFKRFQIPLLQLANTDSGRDLLCIDKNLPQIVEMGKNYVKGYLGEENGKDYFIHDFRVGCKWGNVIRHRWEAFRKDLKRFYKDKDGFLKPVIYDEVNNLYKAAAATDTFRPAAHPETGLDSVDGYTRIANPGISWANIVGGAGTQAVDDDVQILLWLQQTATSNTWSTLTRGNMLYYTAALGTSVTIESADQILTGYDQLDTIGLGAGFDFNIYTSSPASNEALVAADYAKANYGTTALSDTDIDYSTVNAAGDNTWALNASGLAAISKTGTTKLGIRLTDYDVNENAPAWSVASSLNTLVRFRAADYTGTASDPRLVVMSSSSVNTDSIEIGGMDNMLSPLNRIRKNINL